MLRIDVTLEDCRIIAERDKPTRGVWNTTFYDAYTGDTHTMNLADGELSAILALGISGESDMSPEYSQHCYAIAEPIVSLLPSTIRPIP